MSKMLNVEVQLASKMPGSLIPTWAKKHAEQALTPGRMTPARYRFDAAVAYHANYASTNNGPCLEITPAVRCRTSLALMHKRPMGCRGVLSRQGESVHLFQRHSPRTCRIPPERGYLLVQSAASLQRFASGSDAAHYSSPSLASSPSIRTSMTRPSANSFKPSTSGS